MAVFISSSIYVLAVLLSDIEHAITSEEFRKLLSPPFWNLLSWQFPGFMNLIVVVFVSFLIAGFVILRRPLMTWANALEASLFVVASVGTMYVVYRFFLVMAMGARYSF